MKRKINIIYLIFLILIPIFLILLPSTFFDEGDSVCLSVTFFNRECIGCGITRAIQHLIHFNFIKAYEFNKLSIFVLPLLIASFFKEVKRILKVLKD